MSWTPASHGQFASLEEAIAYFDNELRQLSTSLSEPTEVLSLQTLYAPPLRPREGDIVKADGVTWDPAASETNPKNKGAGFYGYRAGAWVKLDVSA